MNGFTSKYALLVTIGCLLPGCDVWGEAWSAAGWKQQLEHVCYEHSEIEAEIENRFASLQRLRARPGGREECDSAAQTLRAMSNRLEYGAKVRQSHASAVPDELSKEEARLHDVGFTSASMLDDIARRFESCEEVPIGEYRVDALLNEATGLEGAVLKDVRTQLDLCDEAGVEPGVKLRHVLARDAREDGGCEFAYFCEIGQYCGARNTCIEPPTVGSPAPATLGESLDLESALSFDGGFRLAGADWTTTQAEWGRIAGPPALYDESDQPLWETSLVGSTVRIRPEFWTRTEWGWGDGRTAEGRQAVRISFYPTAPLTQPQADEWTQALRTRMGGEGKRWTRNGRRSTLEAWNVIGVAQVMLFATLTDEGVDLTLQIDRRFEGPEQRGFGPNIGKIGESWSRDEILAVLPATLEPSRTSDAVRVVQATGGLRRGDIIVSVGGKRTRAPIEIDTAIAGHQVGEPIEVTVVRQGVEKSINVALVKNR